jgi:putative Mn2+ efflux pump MntP
MESRATQFVEFHQRASVERLSNTVDAFCLILLLGLVVMLQHAQPDEQKQRKSKSKSHRVRLLELACLVGPFTPLRSLK